ncbi:hypothetical protein J6590_017854 [Homalodisca vitripennis]|nr:hypothetical protein J6590_017854 [Homalodisca vitripennis]
MCDSEPSIPPPFHFVPSRQEDKKPLIALSRKRGQDIQDGSMRRRVGGIVEIICHVTWEEGEASCVPTSPVEVGRLALAFLYPG